MKYALATSRMPPSCFWVADHRICSHRQYVPLTTTKQHTRHRIELGHVADKVHLVCRDGGDAHEKLGCDVEHGEEHDREVVGHERGGGPVSVDEDFPSAELEERMVKQ